MDVIFTDDALKELYETGSTKEASIRNWRAIADL